MDQILKKKALPQKQKQSQLNPSIYPDGIVRPNERFCFSVSEDTKFRNILPSCSSPKFMKRHDVVEFHIHSHNNDTGIGYHKDEPSLKVF